MTHMVLWSQSGEHLLLDFIYKLTRIVVNNLGRVFWVEAVRQTPRQH